jgi:hypothetical protein
MKEEILGFESRGSANKTRPGRPNAIRGLGQLFSRFSDDGNYAVVVGRDCRLEGLLQGVTQGR